MIKHIVMWTLKNKNDAHQIKELLEKLKESVPNIIELEVGINYNTSDAAADVVLYSTFSNKSDLMNYQEHPNHQAVIPVMQRLTKLDSRKVVDYEI